MIEIKQGQGEQSEKRGVSGDALDIPHDSTRRQKVWGGNGFGLLKISKEAGKLGRLSAGDS